MLDHPTQLAEKLAENRARHIRPAIADQFAPKLACPPADIRFHSIADTRHLLQRWADLTRGPCTLQLQTTDRAAILAAIATVRPRLDLPLLLFHDRCDESGAIRTAGHQALDRLDALLEYDAEDLCLADDGMTLALLVEYYPDPTTRTATYHFKFWHACSSPSPRDCDPGTSGLAFRPN